MLFMCFFQLETLFLILYLPLSSLRMQLCLFGFIFNYFSKNNKDREICEILRIFIRFLFIDINSCKQSCQFELFWFVQGCMSFPNGNLDLIKVFSFKRQRKFLLLPFFSLSVLKMKKMLSKSGKLVVLVGAFTIFMCTN